MARSPTGLFQGAPDHGDEMVDFILRLAFAAPESLVPGSFDTGALGTPVGTAESAFSIARKLSLAEIIGARLPLKALQSWVGTEEAQLFSQAHRISLGRVLLFEQLAEELQAAADGLGTPLIFLKGFGLHLAGLGLEGARAFVDIDIAAPEGRTEELHAALVTRGFKSPDVMPTEQHLPPLISPNGCCVDLHFCLKGVNLETANDATVGEILDLGLFTSTEKLSNPAQVLERSLFAAHILAHGLAHHGHRPGSYPLLRLVYDLNQLLPDSGSWDRFELEGYRWIEGAVSQDLLGATRQLCEQMKKPHPNAGESRDSSPAQDLLDHFVAGALDPEYVKAHRLGHASQRIQSERERGNLNRYLFGKALPSRGELEIRYSRSLPGWRVIPWRIWHLTRQIGRLFSWGVAARRNRADQTPASSSRSHDGSRNIAPRE